MTMRMRSSGYYIPAICIFILALACYRVGGSHLAGLAFASNDAPFFGADTVDIIDAMRTMTFAGDMRKHLLFSVIMAHIVQFVEAATGAGERESILAACALIASLNVTLCWVIFRKCAGSFWTALVLTALYALSACNLIHFNIPETYALACLASILFLLLLLRDDNVPNLGRSAGYGAMAALCGLINIPLLSILMVHGVYLIMGNGIRASIRPLLLAGVVALLLFCLPYALIHGGAILDFSSNYANKWADVGNFRDVLRIGWVYLNFFIFSVSFPIGHLSMEMPIDVLRQLAGRATAIAAIILYLAIAIRSVWSAISARDQLMGALAVWVVSIATFYIYFNPHEAFLYSPQIILPLYMMGARYLARRGPREKHAGWAFAVLALLLLINNVPAIFGGLA